MSNRIVGKCSFDGCHRNSYKSGICSGHYRQFLDGKPLTKLRFRAASGKFPAVICDEAPCPNSDLEGPCHSLRRKPMKNGYGALKWKGKNVLAHRHMWEIEVGPIPEGMVIDHMCRNRRCCNTSHLRVVTSQVNNTENVVGVAWQKQKAKTHCKQGHPFDESNTYIYKKTNGRVCRKCRIAHNRKWLAKLKVIEASKKVQGNLWESVTEA